MQTADKSVHEDDIIILNRLWKSNIVSGVCKQIS